MTVAINFHQSSFGIDEGTYYGFGTTIRSIHHPVSVGIPRQENCFHNRLGFSLSLFTKTLGYTQDEKL